jgi:hypothetical protein
MPCPFAPLVSLLATIPFLAILQNKFNFWSRARVAKSELESILGQLEQQSQHNSAWCCDGFGKNGEFIFRRKSFVEIESGARLEFFTQAVPAMLRKKGFVVYEDAQLGTLLITLANDAEHSMLGPLSSTWRTCCPLFLQQMRNLGCSFVRADQSGFLMRIDAKLLGANCLSTQLERLYFDFQKMHYPTSHQGIMG